MTQVHNCATSMTSVSVIGPQFCVPYPNDFVVEKKAHSLGGGNFVIRDVNDNIVFKLKQNNSALHNQRVLLDAAETPIATLREKFWTDHYRWQVFEGESKKIIFSTNTPHMIQFQTNLNVYLANNIRENSCDFKVEGSWSKRSCTYYAGDSSTIIAQMHMKKPEGSGVVLGKDKFMVTISPNVDYAFIVVLIAILEGTSTNMATSSGLMVTAAVGAS